MSAPTPAINCFYEVIVNFPDDTHVNIGSFLKVSGISTELEAVESRVTAADTTGDTFSDTIPGRVKYTDIVLTHAVTSGGFWQWQKAIEEGKDARVDLTIVAKAPDGTEKARWNVVKAWPRKVTVSELGSANAGLLTEEITLAHNGIEFDQAA